MLEVELDVFSGMPNPRWLLSQKEEKELVDQLAADPAQVSPAATDEEQFSLGYRGLLVRVIKPDEGPWAAYAADVALPDEFRVGSSAASEAAAAWLLGTSEPSHKRSGVTDELRSVAGEGIALVRRRSDEADPATFTGPPIAEVDDPEVARFPVLDGEGADVPSAPGAVGSDVTGGAWYACSSNVFLANADVFNRPENVRQPSAYRPAVTPAHAIDVAGCPPRRPGRA